MWLVFKVHLVEKVLNIVEYNNLITLKMEKHFNFLHNYFILLGELQPLS
jgi:recombinational DNA repair protein RecR